MSTKIEYERIEHPRYKYRLTQECVIGLGLEGRPASIRGYITLWEDGLLSINPGYCWDGASGPAIDSANFMRGSLVHDALYQLIREKQLRQEFRRFADLILYRIVREDGMSPVRALWVWAGVRLFGRRSARK